MAKATKRNPIAGDEDFPIYQLGIKEGRRQMKVESLTYLQDRYMDREVERNSPEAKAILELAQDLSQHLNGQ